MSLVGPRPERPCFVEDLKREIPRYALRHKMKAGMTGWAQVHGMRGNTCIQKRVELDLYYIENWSVGLDVKILMNQYSVVSSLQCLLRVVKSGMTGSSTLVMCKENPCLHLFHF